MMVTKRKRAHQLPRRHKSGKYFPTNPYMRRRFDAVGRKLAFGAVDRNEWVDWQRKLTHKLRELIGYNSMVKATLESRITDEIEFEHHVRQRVDIQTEPGVIMPMFVLIPRHFEPPYPAVIAAHGHSSGGKLAVAGCREIPQIAEVIKKYNYDYGLQFARAGFITFCPDARGFGERQEAVDREDILASSCQWLNNMAYPLGQTLTGMWTWDLHRLIDYAQTRPDVRTGQIGCAGLSAGGLQTLWATALDKRIRCAVISGYMYGYKESLLDGYANCGCNYVPHLYEYVDMGDIAALIAPRPLLIETGNKDSLNGVSGLRNVRGQVQNIRKAYRLLESPRMLKHVVFEGGHAWHGRYAIPWMKRFLR